MEKIISLYKKREQGILLVVGLCLVSLIVLPYFLLGEASYVEVHDQLDGEVLNYIYRAKYFLQGKTIPEFMNGMSKAAMTMPAPFGLLFYKILPPFWAFVSMQWLGVLVAFVGMYFLCKEWKIQPVIGFCVAMLFAYMRFYPVYGLAAYGQPLLLWCAINIEKRKKQILAFVGIVFYAGFSSLTLVGYVWEAFGLLYLIYLFGKKSNPKKIGLVFTGWSVMTVTYLLTNLELLESIFNPTFETHRSEMVLHPIESFTGKFAELFLQGGSYSKTYSPFILAVAALWLAALMVCKQTRKAKENKGNIGWLIFIGIVAGLTILATLWNATFVISLRKQIGGIVCYFQADRVYWIFPFLWMVTLAFLLQNIYEVIKGTEKKKFQYVAPLLITIIVLGEGALIFRDSTLNKNMRFLLSSNYKQITWESLYMDDVFEKIDGLVGKDKENYSCISLGMYPSIALYHGYTCADGYSNNYDLEYKHTFRKIIAKELEQKEEVKAYFDDWGNRLYAATAKYGFHTLMEKNGGYVFEQLNFDVDAMKEMNIKYIFSAAKIENAEGIGLSQVTEKPVSTDTSYYEVWVYQVK